MYSAIASSLDFAASKVLPEFAQAVSLVSAQDKKSSKGGFMDL
jgi:hypothetical protein